MTTSSEPSTELPRFGRYRTVARLGAGAAGEVFHARDEMLDRDVAIKTVTRVGRHAALSSARFFNEARAVAALSHPSVIRVFDMGEQDGTPYLVMELATGGALRERLHDGPPVGLDEACALGIQIAQALAAAHARGIVHRDVKPANVLRDADGVWRLADFGVAHVPDSTLTLAGQFLGSPAYAAPESLEAGEFSAASDVWGLAATLYEVLGGEAPWGDRDYAGILEALDAGPPPLATRAPTLPPAITGAIDRALSRAPADRPSAQELAAALATGRGVAVADQAPPPPRRRRRQARSRPRCRAPPCPQWRRRRGRGDGSRWRSAPPRW
ncbi:MAG: serine/threonine protein kinase [Kofleriaceae bacterium]|nr:serine/threonine protein kinase [Kofleriaceae bacterium]